MDQDTNAIITRLIKEDLLKRNLQQWYKEEYRYKHIIRITCAADLTSGKFTKDEIEASYGDYINTFLDADWLYIMKMYIKRYIPEKYSEELGAEKIMRIVGNEFAINVWGKLSHECWVQYDRNSRLTA